MSLKTKSGKSPYEIALDIKELMDEKSKNKVILEATGLKQTQLTNYKTIIRNGYIDELRSGIGVKELFKKASLHQNPISKKSVETQTDKKEQKSIDPSLNSNMINHIENEPDVSDVFMEYKDTSPQVKLDNLEIGRKSRVPDEGMKSFIDEDGKEIKYRPLAEHININVLPKNYLLEIGFQK